MKKCIIMSLMALVLCTGILVAQNDIEGSYRATGQRVEYQYYTRPNDFGLAGGAADGSTTLKIYDSYNLGVETIIAEIPKGYNMGEKIVGPIGRPKMDAMQYFLYVTFNEDLTGEISNSQVLAGETVNCKTDIVLLPLDDDLEYSSNLDAGVEVQATMVDGHPNASPYVGQPAGTWSVSNSSFFSYFPQTPTPVTHTLDYEDNDPMTPPYTLYGDAFAACYGACVAETGDHATCGGVTCAQHLVGFPGAPYPGKTAGYLIEDPETSFAPDNVAYGLVGDLHVEWHYIDGPVAGTGEGDDETDEDGDGSDYDNILGYGDMLSTYLHPGVSESCPMDFEFPILGDVRDALTGAGLGGCIDEGVGGPIHETEPGTFGANQFYVLVPDGSALFFNNFLTWNGVMYGLTGDANFLVNDSLHDVDPTEITYLDLGGLCTDENGAPIVDDNGAPLLNCPDGVPDTPYNQNGGRIVMNFDATCIPVITAISVLGELTQIDCENQNGDIDGNGLSVTDVVQIINHVLLTDNLEDAFCVADINLDGNVDILDVVVIVNLILAGTDERVQEATSASFTKTEAGMVMSSDGVVGAVQMTLSHGSDFSIELADDAFIAEYNTNGNTTTLIVVNPNEDIFVASGKYNVDSVVAATTEGYIAVDIITPSAIAVSNAYPNPFNPSTSFDINVGLSGEVSVMVYNVNGQVVDMIHEGPMDAGVYSMTWNASDLSSGMYIIKANNADVTVSQKVMLIK